MTSAVDKLVSPTFSAIAGITRLSSTSVLIKFIPEFISDGIRKKTQESCDSMIKLSYNKNFKSFNVSVATGIILSEIARQRKC